MIRDRDRSPAQSSLETQIKKLQNDIVILQAVAKNAKHEHQEQNDDRDCLERQIKELQCEVSRLKIEKKQSYNCYGDKLKTAAQMNRNLRDEIDALKEKNRRLRVARSSQLHERTRAKKKGACTLL